MRNRGFVSLLLTLLACSLLSVFTGCNSAPNNSDSDSITLEFWTLQLNTFEHVIQPAIDSFEHEHPGVTVRWVDVPFSQGEKRALTAMLSPHVPDVINLNPDFAALLAARGTLLNMATAVPKSVQQQYLPAAWDACTLHQPNQPPLTFGVPWYLTSSILLANSRLQSGPPPQSLEALVKLQSHQPQSASAQHAYLFYPFITQSGGLLKALFAHGLYQPGDRISSVLRNKTTHQFLTRWQQLFQHGAIPREALTDGPQGAVDRFQAGTLAWMNTGTNFLNIIKENAPQVYAHTQVYSQFPLGTKNPLFSTMLLAVPAQSEHPKLAAQLATHITNTTHQLALAAEAPVLPSTVQGVKQLSTLIPSYDEDAKQRTARTLSAQQLLSAQQAYPAIPNQKPIHDWVDHYTQAALLGTMDVSTALEHAAHEIESLEPSAN